jgi:hypothetical protein
MVFECRIQMHSAALRMQITECSYNTVTASTDTIMCQDSYLHKEKERQR